MSAEPITVLATGQPPVPPANAAAAPAEATNPEAKAASLDGSLAARLRAKHEQIRNGTQRFPIPGWDGELVLEAKVLRDSKRLSEGLTNVQLINEATVRVLARTEDGEYETVDGGWSGLGELMGIAGANVSVGQIINAVLDNPLRRDGFAEQLLSWMMGRRSLIEQALGE